MLEHIKPGSLMIGYIHGGTITEVFSESLHEFRDLDAQNLKLLNSYSSARGPFHEDNRNKIVDMALSKEKVEWLLFIDTDIKWKPEVPYQLLHMADDNEHRIVSGLYFGRPGWSDVWLPQWYSLNEKNEFIITPVLNGNPLQKVDAVGTGIVLIHTSVFKEFPEVDHGWRWFGRDPWTIDGKVTRIGEDLSFFLRCNQLCYPGYERWSNLPPKKIPIWGHRGVVVEHVKEIGIGLVEYFMFGNVVAKNMEEEEKKRKLASLSPTINDDSPRIIIPDV